MGAASARYAWTMRRILKIMELVSGLKVNFDKSSLMGINVGEERIREMAEILQCTGRLFHI